MNTLSQSALPHVAFDPERGRLYRDTKWPERRFARLVDLPEIIRLDIQLPHMRQTISGPFYAICDDTGEPPLAVTLIMDEDEFFAVHETAGEADMYVIRPCLAYQLTEHDLAGTDGRVVIDPDHPDDTLPVSVGTWLMLEWDGEVGVHTEAHFARTFVLASPTD